MQKGQSEIIIGIIAVVLVTASAATGLFDYPEPIEPEKKIEFSEQKEIKSNSDNLNSSDFYNSKNNDPDNSFSEKHSDNYNTENDFDNFNSEENDSINSLNNSENDYSNNSDTRTYSSSKYEDDYDDSYNDDSIYKTGKNFNSNNSLSEIPVPQNVQAEPGPTIGQITIQWDEVAGADYYNVNWEAYNCPGSWDVGVFRHVPLNIMTDSFNFEERLHKYQVQACDQFDECSEYSFWASAYPQIGVEINAPSVEETNTLIIALAEIQLTNWPEIEWTITGNSSCTAPKLDEEDLRMTCTSKGNVNVSVRVNSQENNVATDSVTIVILEDEINTAPETPGGIALRPGNEPGEMEVEWDRVDGVDYYEVKWEVPGFPYGDVIQVDGQLDSVTYKTTFPAEQSLEYHANEVRACNDFGCSEWTNDFFAYPKLGVEVEAPSVIAINSIEGLNAKLTYFDSSTPSSFEWSLSENTANCFLDDPEIQNPEIECYSIGFVTVKVKTWGNNFDSAENEKVISVNDNLISIPPVPGNVKAEKGDESGKIKVSWNPSPSADYYEVKWRAQGNTHMISPITITTAIYKTTVSPEISQPLHFNSARACNLYGCSAFSSEKEAYPKMGVVISGPTIVEKDITFTMQALVEYPVGTTYYSWNSSNHYAVCTIYNQHSLSTTINCSSFGFTEITLLIENDVFIYSYMDSAEDTKIITVIENSFDMLQPPQNVKAFPGDNPGEIKITWNPVEGAEYYGIDWFSEQLNEDWHQPYHGVVGGYSNSYTFVWDSPPEEETGKFYFTVSAAKGDYAGYYSEQVWSYLRLGAKIDGPDSIAILEAVGLNGKTEYSAGNNSFLWALNNNTANCSLLTSNQENTTIQCTQTGSAEVKLTMTAENGTAEYKKTITIASQSSKGYGQKLAT